MEYLNKNQNDIQNYEFENIQTIEKDENFILDWGENEDDETEEIIYEIKILFIGNTLSGKSFIISKLIEEFNNSNENLRINSSLYKRTIGLDKRLHQVMINGDNFIIKYYEISSNLDFTRLNDFYFDFLNSFDLLFFIFNKEINYNENLVFLDNFKNSLIGSYLINEQNAKYFLEKKLFVINSFLKYDNTDMMKHIYSIRQNKARLSIYIKKESNDLFDNKDFLYFEFIDYNNKINSNKISNVKKEEKFEYKNMKFLINQIQFHINKFVDFKKEFSNLVYTLFYRKDTIIVNSKRSNEKNHNNLFINLTIVKNNDKDVFDLSNKFFFDKQRKKAKKKITC